mmetsp:Transcript_1035/g.1133  ORF Transcript_1035/g.1133 Transcript_1035/m.1133 type:complete len:411 (-) Transcript_1035:248-1480(-)
MRLSTATFGFGFGFIFICVQIYMIHVNTSNNVSEDNSMEMSSPQFFENQSAAWEQHPNVNNNEVTINQADSVVKDNNERSILDPLNCNQFLDDYNNDRFKVTYSTFLNFTEELKELEPVIQARHTITEIPFWVSLHDKTVDFVRWCIYKNGRYYENALSDAISTALKQEREQDERLFIDVGGNIGWFSLLAASYNANVYTFEPNPMNILRICQSLQLNDWLSTNKKNGNNGPHVEIYDKGVSDEHGVELKLRAVDPQNPGSFSFHQKHEIVKVKPKKFGFGSVHGTFQLITLDEWAKSKGWFDEEKKISFMKLDVEGLELKVIRGCKKLLMSNLIKNIAMEFKGEPEFAHERTEILETLYKAGYELYKHGKWMGPNKLVKKKYTNMTDLSNDVDNKVVGENLWFKLRVTF